MKMEKPFQISVDGKSVLGMIHEPSVKARGNPTAVMIYGFNGERVDNNRISVLCGRYAQRHGITFVRFDYRGLGVSEGEFWDTTLDTKLRDAREIIRYIADQSDGTLSLFLVGFSDGVRIATTLLEQSENICGMCMWSPVLFPLVDEVHGRMPGKFSRHPQTGRLVVPHRGLWVGQQYLRQVSTPDKGYERIKSSSKPILAVFGGGDDAVEVTKHELEKLLADGRSNIGIKTIEEADHLFSREKWRDEVTKETVQWILDISGAVS